MKISVTLSPAEIREAVEYWLLRERGLYGVTKCSFNIERDYSGSYDSTSPKYQFKDLTVDVADYAADSPIAKKLKQDTAEKMTVEQKKKLGLDLS